MVKSNVNAAGPLVVIGGLFLCSLAHADLYTGQIASLEWKVHSSDLVLLVSVESTSSGEFAIELLDQFARDNKEAADAASLAAAWEPPQRYRHDWKPDGDWLLFVRRWNDEDPTVDHTVYLENPLQASRMSAVTAEGKVLEERQEILAVINDRLARGESMTERQRLARRLVDQGSLPSIRQRKEELRATHQIEPWLGGFQIPADISLWDKIDSDRSFNESLWVNHLTVPADAAYGKIVFDYWTNDVRMSEQERQKTAGSASRYPLGALVNYPGEQTEELLEKLMVTRQYLDPVHVLNYLRFHEPKFDADDRQLVGSWIATSSVGQIQFDLMANHELLAHCRPSPFPHSNKHEREWIAKGRWNLHHGILRFLGTSLRVGSSDRFRQQSSPRQLLFHPHVVRVSKDKIVMEDGIVWERVQTPIDVPK